MDGDKHSCSLSKCRKPDDDDMVACDTCKRWWHYACAKFDPDSYDTTAPWFCGEINCEPREDETEFEGQGSSVEKQLNDSMNLLIEAAAVAQATVLQKDSELVALRKEMDELKARLTKLPPDHKAVHTDDKRSSTPKKLDDRLEMIKKIQSNHKSLMNNIVHQQKSTPGEDLHTERDQGFHQSFRDADMSSLLTILNRSNVQELPTFSGEDKREWPYFVEVFNNTTEEGRFSGKENVSRLRKALRGEAYQLVSERLKYSSDADAIMESLRVVFGRYDVLVHDLTTDLLCLPVLSSKCDPKVRLWAVKLNGFVADIKSMKRDDDLNNGFVLTSLAGKLGPGLYQEWVRNKSGILKPNLTDLADFVTEKVINLPPELIKQSRSDTKYAQKIQKATGRVLTHLPVSKDAAAERCIKCGRSQHSLDQCFEFKELSVEERLAFAKKRQVCFSCLVPSKHDWKLCQKKSTCGIVGCDRRHHPLLHPTSVSKAVGLNAAASPFVSQPHIHSSHVGLNASVFFKIVPVRIHGPKKSFIDTFAFLDDGSSLSMVERDIFDELGLIGEPERLTLQWTKGVSRHEDSIRTCLSVSGVNNRKHHLLKNVYTVKNLELPAQTLYAAELQRLYPHLRGLPLSDLVNAKPKLLVGLDQAKFLLGSGQRHGKDDQPCAIKTLLGWIVYGSASPSLDITCLSRIEKPSMHFMFHDAMKHEDQLHELVRLHFTTEDFGVMAPKGDLISKDESRAINIMERTLRRVGECYEIGLLWSKDDIKLPDSYPMALKRLEGLEKSLRKKPELLEWKNNHMKELLSKGYARIASSEELSKEWPRVWYAPTFVVVNPNKFPLKPRDVADVAAKVGQVSLNTYLLKGPDNLVPLHAGLFKFRERAVAINADVKEMFHQIRIREEDQQCQRILWRDGDSSRLPTVYIMQVMMFGPKCSPTSSQFVKNHHAQLFREDYPEAVEGLTKYTYVDDYFNSHDSVEKAVKVTRDAIHICKTMNFDLVGVQSNSQEVLFEIPESHVKASLVKIDPNECESTVSKILGMYWKPSSDYFTYKLANVDSIDKMLIPEISITKRTMLRTIMRIFDPLGLMSYFIIRGRIVLQEVWREGFDWDEDTSKELKSCWLLFLKELKNIEGIRVPRRYVSYNPDQSNMSMIVFVDASEKAFAAVAYFRFERDGKVEISQVMAKSKVAPIKKLSVPRLELQAAVLGVRLAATIRASHSICIGNTMFLSDSKTVLSWICSTKFKFPAFVSVRIGEILETTSPRQWFHVRTNENVADDATRWNDPSLGDTSSRWFGGPTFLKSPMDSWPISPGKSEVVTQNCELDSSNILLIHNKSIKVSYSIYEELKGRFRARWASSVRVIAFLLRYKDILQKKQTVRETFITPEEYQHAENWIFRKIQSEVFPEEIECLQKNGNVKVSSSIVSFSPFLDKENTIRMSSRAQRARVSYAARNPAILPKNHALVSLLIEHYHVKNLHMGSSTVIGDIREHVWIISIRGALERVRSKCYMCKRMKAKPVMPLMGQLPEARLAFHSRPFTYVGVDCFGPLLVKYGRGTVKRYGMIFTCLTFRAVQIEMLNDLSLDQCTMAVRRFVINRVVTRFIYSDNGLNFIGTRNQIDKDVKEMENALCEYAAKYEGICWRFIPAYSPWFGGAWERLIKSVKNSIEFVLRGVVPREDVLRNALIEAQGQINRRPLTHVPVDPEDPQPLTPNLMLFGDEERDITAPGVFTDRDLCSKLYSRRSQHLMAQITRRWYTEYLPDITRRSKWYMETKAVEVGTIVVLVDPNELRCAWKLGRVEKIYPGPDGIVRTADVKLSNGVLKMKRSVGRLAVLDLESSP